jgi:diamine N-acetyltransferase
MADPTFRPAREDDRDTLLGMMRQFYAIDAYPFDPATASRALGALLADPTLGGVWTVERDGEAIGYLVLTWGYSLEWGGRDAFVDELFLVAAERGRGIGRRAIDFALAECRARGIRALHLEVERGNAAGQALYRRAGFTDHDRLLLAKAITPYGGA